MRHVGFQPASPLKVWAVSGAGIAAQALGLAEAIARRMPAQITSRGVAQPVFFLSVRLRADAAPRAHRQFRSGATALA